MGELLVLLFVIGLAWLALKIVGAIFHFTFAALTLPFQILAVLATALIGVIVAIPLALIAGLLGLMLAPLLLLAPLLPFILIGCGILFLLKNNHSHRPMPHRGQQLPPGSKT